jgi:2'-5' RNA ligase
MRLFTGISIDPQISANIEQALATLRPLAPLNWSPPENLHITTKFIGKWPEDKLPELTNALGAAAQTGKIRIDISNFGFFPNPHHPRFFFAGVHAGPELTALATRTDLALEPLGCPRETRLYTPHLTLARIRHGDIPENLRRLRGAVTNVTNCNFGSFMAETFHLYLSTPGHGGSIYQILASFSL